MRNRRCAMALVASVSLTALPARAELTFGTSCSDGRQAIVTDAHGRGQDLATRADAFMTHLVDDAPGEGSDAGTSWPERRLYFERWFGPFDTGRANEVRDHFVAIRAALLRDEFVINCQGNSANCGPGTIAWVHAADMRPTINLCEPFWTRPDYGLTSQGGAILHEVSHFERIAKTVDVLDEVTPRECEQLAVSKPSEAVTNAYNHQYFAEDMPTFGCGGCAVGSRRRRGVEPLWAMVALMLALRLAVASRTSRRRRCPIRRRRPA